MEEILNTGNAPLGQKEFTFPANVKQMGNIDRKFKIYIEDYVYIFISMPKQAVQEKNLWCWLESTHMLMTVTYL